MFVLDRYGHPLQPCHPARARKLLASGQAVVIHHTPFTVRLRDRTVAESTVQGVEVGIDPGSKHTGISVFTAREGTRSGRYSLQLDHRGSAIRDKLTQRSNYRRGRRSRNLRYRAPRFSNRTRPDGWLAPSLRHRVDTTMSWVGRLAQRAPIRAIHLERVSFDTHAMTAGRPLQGVEYQQGTLAGYEIRQYLLEKFGRACVYCGSEGVPLQVEHIHPRACGGSNRISNLTLACEKCNLAKNTTPIEMFLKSDPTLLDRILTTTKAPLQDAAAVNTTRWALWRSLLETGLPVHTASGNGFPRLRLPRTKTVHGYQTGDLVRAAVPTGKKTGTHIGRVAVRSNGRFNITTPHGTVQGIGHKYVRLLQRADGYGYTTIKETTLEP